MGGHAKPLSLLAVDAVLFVVVAVVFCMVVFGLLPMAVQYAFIRGARWWTGRTDGGGDDNREVDDGEVTGIGGVFFKSRSDSAALARGTTRTSDCRWRRGAVPCCAGRTTPPATRA